MFLDRLGLLAAPIESYVFGEGFESLSAEGADRELRLLLEKLRTQAAGLDSEMRRAVEDVLTRFGDSPAGHLEVRASRRS